MSLRLRKTCLIFLAGCGSVLLSFFYIFYYFPYHPLSSYRDDYILFYLSPGTSLKGTVNQLVSKGILHKFNAPLFYVFVKSKRAATALQAGEYLFSSTFTPQHILHKLLTGEVVQYTLTFQEGITFQKMLQNIESHPAVEKKICHKTPKEIMYFVGNVGDPEGWFFPETYRFAAHTTDVALLKRAYHLMQKKLQVAWENRDPTICLKTPYEALILASIIEKETAHEAERALVSGVFHRRLANNMRLQADPTVAYGLNGNYRGFLSKADLQRDTPYNTYLHKGLPPTPIALPSLSAIQAALHPAQGKALYFVAKGDGTHYFSVTLGEHNKAVIKYLRGTAR